MTLLGCHAAICHWMKTVTPRIAVTNFVLCQAMKRQVEEWTLAYSTKSWWLSWMAKHDLESSFVGYVSYRLKADSRTSIQEVCWWIHHLEYSSIQWPSPRRSNLPTFILFPFKYSARASFDWNTWLSFILHVCEPYLQVFDPRDELVTEDFVVNLNNSFCSFLIVLSGSAEREEWLTKNTIKILLNENRCDQASDLKICCPVCPVCIVSRMNFLISTMTWSIFHKDPGHCRRKKSWSKGERSIMAHFSDFLIHSEVTTVSKLSCTGKVNGRISKWISKWIHEFRTLL